MLTYDAKNVINGTYGEIWCDSDYLAEAIGLEAKITLDKSEVNMCRKLSKGAPDGGPRPCWRTGRSGPSGSEY